MNRKKIGALLVSMCISMSLMTSTAFGAQADSNSLENAILNVKSIISISDDYDDFSYSVSHIDENENKIDVWNLNWNSDDNNKGQIRAEIDSYGNLIRYNKFCNNNDVSSLAKVSREEAETSAENFLKKVMSDYVTDMRLIDTNAGSDSGNYNFVYQQYVNDIPVTFFKVSIGVNKETGEIRYYYGVEPGTKKIEYPKADNIINADSAKSKYVDSIQEDLSYYSVYDYKNKNLKTFPVYEMDNNEAIDAFSGDVVKVDDSGIAIYDKEATSEDSTGGDSGLSSIEKEAVDNVSGLMSKEKARELLNEKYELLSKMKDGDSYLYKDDINNYYIWEFNFDNGSAEINAQTGEILEFYIQRSVIGISENGNTEVSEEQAKEKAEEFLKKISGSKFSETKLSDSYSGEKSYSFEYTRQANGKDCKGNKLSIDVDKSTGKIISYSCRWYDNAVFEDISNAISKSEAFDKFNESNNFGLNYVMTENNKVALVYGFYKDEIPYEINALSGKKVNYIGNDYNEYEEDKMPEYQDIKGHWCEETVQQLMDSGYYICGDKFNPDKDISQINFFRYMLSSRMNSYSDDDLYNMLMNKGIISSEEKNPSKAVTNKEAAKFITRYLGYDKLAKHSEIFNNKFNDSIDDEYLGYASICYALGIIKGDSKGNFNENQNITNATAAEYIYNILSGNNKKDSGYIILN